MTIEERYDRLISSEVNEWLSNNEKEDLNKILLSPPQVIKPVLSEAVDQLRAKAKARKKLPSWYDEPRVLWPPPISIEQASSEVAAAFKASLIQGKKLTDLTGGSGVDILTMSKEFETAHFVEKDEWLCKVFAHNRHIFGNLKIVVKNTLAEKALDLIEKDQWVYIDPARRDHQKNKVFKLDDCSPNLVDVVPAIMQKGASIMMKLSPLLDISELINELKPDSIYVVAVNNEVKELLAIRTTSSESLDPLINAVDLSHGQKIEFKFRYTEEKIAETLTAPAEKFLYEPNAAIMKAGAFKLIGKAHGLRKLHRNTHLYTSNKFVEDFPGRVFSVIRSLTSKELKREYARSDLHVISRNHPINANQITQKFHLKETGNKYLLAFTDQFEKKKLILSERLKTGQSAS